jgi:hypothetical protein
MSRPAGQRPSAPFTGQEAVPETCRSFRLVADGELAPNSVATDGNRPELNPGRRRVREHRFPSWVPSAIEVAKPLVAFDHRAIEPVKRAIEK